MRDLLWSYFSFLSNDILIVNEPFADAVADHKLLQLRTAKKCGLRIPTSLFTNDPSQVKAFVHRMRACGSKVVYKQLSPGSSVITHFTRVLTKEDEDRLEDIQGSPVILQEKIEGGVDVRVNIIGEAIYAMAHSPEEPGLVDIRSASRTQCARVTIPAQVELALRDFHNQCRIQFGAYDFIIDAAGNWYFLELNPGGQWLFVETAVSFPIAEAFAHLLWYGKVDVNKLKGNAYADNDLDHLLGPFLKGVMERALKTRPNQIIQPAGETC